MANHQCTNGFKSSEKVQRVLHNCTGIAGIMDSWKRAARMQQLISDLKTQQQKAETRISELEQELSELFSVLNKTEAELKAENRELEGKGARHIVNYGTYNEVNQ